MPEAVIVATARSPIGRANKGSLDDVRPDDLAADDGAAALDKVPELDPADIDDLMLGCGLPGGEQGFNMARVVAILLGYDHLPGTTLTRYCASSVQTTRMAFHAIKAGEGDVFVSAGVETVSRYAKGSSDSHPDTRNPLFADAHGAHGEARRDRRRLARPPRQTTSCPTSTCRWARRPRTSPSRAASAASELDEFGVRSQNLAEQALAAGFWQREIEPVTLADGIGRRRRRRSARRRHLRGGVAAQAGVPPERPGHGRQLLPAQRRRGRGGGDERRQGRRARHHAAGPHRRHRASPACRRRSWASVRSRRPARRWPAPG